MVYAYFFALLLIGAFVTPKKYSNAYLIVMLLYLLCIIGLRDITVGQDTEDYVNDFYQISGYNEHNVFHDILSESEPLYIIITWLSSRFSSSYTFFLYVWALFPITALFVIFRNELHGTIEYCCGFFVFFLIGLFAFFVAGIRQAAALSILLCTYPYLKRINIYSFEVIKHFKDIFIFFLLVFIAYLIHNSSILFILVLFIKDIKVRWWFVFIAVAAYFVGSYLDMGQVVYLASFLFKDRFGYYGESRTEVLSLSGFVMQLILFLICFIKRKTLIKLDPTNSYLFIFMLVGLLVQSLTGVLGEMYRVSFYFSMFGMILVPRALSLYKYTFKSQIASLAFFILSMVYLFYLSSANLPKYQTAFF